MKTRAALRLRQDRRGRPGRRAPRARLALVSSGGTARGARRRRAARHRRRRADRLPGHPRPPRRDAAPGGPRRPAGRPRPAGAPGRPGRATASSRSPSSSPTSTRSPTQPGIELIDVGGPAMVRAAAKNHAHVGVVVDPARLRAVLDELRAAGALSAATRRRLAREAFATTAAYDAADRRLARRAGEPPAPAAPRCPRRCTSRWSGRRTLRYGENPHQQAAPATGRPAHAVVVGRRRPARRQGAVVPQPLRRRGGVAAGAPLRGTGRRHRQARQPVRRGRGRRHHRRYLRAHACDPVSAFGGIVAVNRPVTGATSPRAVARLCSRLLRERHHRQFRHPDGRDPPQREHLDLVDRRGGGAEHHSQQPIRRWDSVTGERVHRERPTDDRGPQPELTVPAGNPTRTSS